MQKLRTKRNKQLNTSYAMERAKDVIARNLKPRRATRVQIMRDNGQWQWLKQPEWQEPKFPGER